MNNRIVRFSVGAVAIGAVALLAQSSQGQSVYYNNSTTFLGDFNYGAGTAGNEVILTSPTGGDVTSFSFQYDLLNSSLGTTGTPGTGDTATLTFWNNYGGAKVSGYEQPNVALFTSSAIPLTGTGTPGYTTGQQLVFSAANGGLPAGGVDVPSIFTWTVTFAGLGTDVAGLAQYGPTPSVGQNYGDAWYSTTPGTWALDVASSGGVPLTFGATITAVPEPSSLGLFAMGATGLLASGWRKLRR